MNSKLPVINVPCAKPLYIEHSEYTDFIEFKEQIKLLIGGDCWAFVVDGEALWNTYTNDSSYSTIIQQNMIRNHIIEDPANLLLHIMRNVSKHYIDIYMYYTDKKRYHVDIKNGKFVFSFFKI
jgi:hypothetical protein